MAKVAERVQFPNQPTKAATSSEIILHQVSEKVNLRVENQTQTKQCMQWFGDWQNNPLRASKIVNSDGTPKVMYHQTDADFSVFRTESTGAGRGDAILPDGAFCKSSDTDIGVSGQKQMQVYLNVRNPLRLKDRASAQAYWEKHVAGYKELMQESQRVDALYNMRMERAEALTDTLNKSDSFLNQTCFFSLRYTVRYMVEKLAAPPSRLEIGSARKTPLTPSPAKCGRRSVSGMTTMPFRKMEKKMA